jgi:hypothetical protein
MPHQIMKKCSKCGEVKDLASFHKLTSSKDGYRSDCKACCKKQREVFKIKNPVRDRTNKMATGILQRTIHDIDKDKNRCYKEHNVKSEIGTTYSEISNYLFDYFYNDIKILIDNGKIPSVDRIDSTGNYSPDNIRIIELMDNVMIGVENAIKKTSKQIKSIKDYDVTVYDSISQASKELKIKRDTIYAHLDKGTLTRYGYKFESI